MTLRGMQLRFASPPEGEGARASRTITIPILRAGIVAAEFCGTPARAEVAAVFERSFYLRCGNLFVCIGEPALGNGPLTLIAQMRAAELGLYPGQPAVISETGTAIGKVAFAWLGCEPWHPPRWPHALAPSVLAQARDAVVRRAATEAPEQGFGRAMAGANESRTALAGIAYQRLVRLQSWLTETMEARGTPGTSSPDCVRDLVGLGPGLTPSGDDALIGALALLDALGEHGAHAILARALGDVPPGLTSPLSHCFLRTAAAGHVGEHLHAAVSSLVCGDVDAAIAAIRNIGHSSGWDMMAGAVIALTASVCRVGKGARMSALPDMRI
jgi:uncharacterized protein DUF2877